MKKIFIILLVICSFYACTNNNYKYVDSNGKSETIEATNDKEAYSLAVRKFNSDKMIHSKISKSLGLQDDGPISFDLYNSKGDRVFEIVNEDSIKAHVSKVVDKVTQPIDEIVKNSIFSDTAKLKDAPIKVTKARFYQEEYSNFKGVSLTFKNISSKKVTAIRFKWYGENAFGEPADAGGFNGWGGGFTDKSLSPGRSMTLQWNVLSRDGKKIIVAYPTEVVFEDGGKWAIE
ncbi:hypothetical protein PIECOFPK_02391 [Mycovorax composti]|uniref:DUF4352 domain-containing protein n=1 Tax=Mycovorax composti TaxID=2962693 RepID=A0ABZ2EMT2_9BACT